MLPLHHALFLVAGKVEDSIYIYPRYTIYSDGVHPAPPQNHVLPAPNHESTSSPPLPSRLLPFPPLIQPLLILPKFMQRGAASSPSSPAQPPSALSPSSSTSSPRPPAYSLAAVQKALLEEEAERQAALDKNVGEGLEVRWSLVGPEGAGRVLGGERGLGMAVGGGGGEGEEEELPWRSGTGSAGRRILGVGRAADHGGAAGMAVDMQQGEEAEGGEDEGVDEGVADEEETLRAQKRVKRVHGSEKAKIRSDPNRVSKLGSDRPKHKKRTKERDKTERRS